IWLVAIFGLRFRISAAALPMLGVGAFLWLIARGKTRSFGALLAGFGLIFTGIDFLQTGMGGVSWNLEAFAGHGFAARWILAGSEFSCRSLCRVRPPPARRHWLH